MFYLFVFDEINHENIILKKKEKQNLKKTKDKKMVKTQKYSWENTILKIFDV